MQEIPKHPPRRPSILGLGVSQALRPTLALNALSSPSELRSRSPSCSSSAAIIASSGGGGNNNNTNGFNSSYSPAQRTSRTSTFFTRGGSGGSAAPFWRVSSISTAPSLSGLPPPPPLTATSLAAAAAQHQQSATASFSPHLQQSASASSRRSSSLVLGTSHQHFVPATTAGPLGAAPEAGAAMPERVGSASSSRAPGVAASAESAIWPASRRTSSVFNRRGTVAFQHHGSTIDLGERTSSKLTLDEELYDLLFAYG